MTYSHFYTSKTARQQSVTKESYHSILFPIFVFGHLFAYSNIYKCIKIRKVTKIPHSDEQTTSFVYLFCARRNIDKFCGLTRKTHALYERTGA